ncbi:protein ABA AND ROS SENSITIVE 1 isoform X2 [Macadamia integrifolia]|uniref:protein ABA AND ROS SENSITIVE 1 isoform X2 n=1 Tax=Macadamia integrifolia TaxID=60698 RepID=UPI001C4E54B9|nr:protein ABA AND ROS SENSITIVE 1 isoform X2 [Macadamia integrifolia]
MDAQAKKKALYRAKLKEAAAQKHEKHIDSPLVRYNEHDQPVCRVCDVTLKSESMWPAHQASRKHHEAIQNVKASAAGLSRVNGGKSDAPVEVPRPESKFPKELQKTNSVAPKELYKVRSSSVLPEGFFDSPDTKRQRTGTGGNNGSTGPQSSTKLVESESSLYEYGKAEDSVQTHSLEPSNSESKTAGLPTVHLVESKERDEIKPSNQLGQLSRKTSVSEVKQTMGALPEGFFDDKDADLRARGIEPVKPDIRDEYKEFEKLIQEDLKEVDERLEEEEFDAAEMIEGAESLEQHACRQRVEMLKNKQMEHKAASSSGKKVPLTTTEQGNNEESSSDEDDDDDFAVDWRAKHL